MLAIYFTYPGPNIWQGETRSLGVKYCIYGNRKGDIANGVFVSVETMPEATEQISAIRELIYSIKTNDQIMKNIEIVYNALNS